jgi:glycolate oxidase FAD binding subunit
MGTGTPRAAADRTLPAALANACADLTTASDRDAISGRQARYVAAPASTTEAAALLRAAAELGLTVVPRGAGSRQHWGAPPTSCDLIVDTRRLDKVIEHAAGDLVVSVQAGVRLDDLAEVLATADQRLALDPQDRGDNAGGTIGGLIATGAAGPLRYRYGSPRDLLIGITIVRADGAIAKSGGKVVKNVAGYDLGKLFAGSYGTLGLITEATFRLHPKPETSTWITVECSDPKAAAEVVRAMADSPLTPAAIELDWPSAAARISVSVLLEGDAVSVAARVDRMVGLLSARGTVGSPSDHTKRSDGDSAHPPLPAVEPDQMASDLPSDTAVLPSDTAIADVEPAVDAFRVHRVPVGSRERPTGAGTKLRIAFWAGQLETVLRIVRTAGAETGVDPAISGSAGAGVLELDVAGEALPGAVVEFVGLVRAGLGGLGAVGGVVPSVASAVVLGASPQVRDAVDVWGPVPSLGLMRAVKDQFDPEHRMAPGRFAGGI